jgi:hypothetical protein
MRRAQAPHGGGSNITGACLGHAVELGRQRDFGPKTSLASFSFFILVFLYFGSSLDFKFKLGSKLQFI